MSLVLNIPTELAKQLVSTWLKIPDLCKLEVSLCSPENHLSMLDIYENVVVPCEQLSHHKSTFQKQLDWMICRKMCISSLELMYPVDRITNLVSLLSSSKDFVRRVQISDTSGTMSTLIMALTQYCTCVESIEVSDCALPVTFCQLLVTSKHLCQLTVRSCTGLEASYFEGLACSSIRFLSNEGECTREVQIALLRACPNLTSYSRHEGEIADLSAVPESLTELSVFECHTINPVQLPKNLSRLSLRNCNVTDNSFSRIMKQCPNLTDIELADNPALSGQSFVQIAQRYSKILTVLTATDCPSLDQAALVALVAKCKSLFSLDIGGNPHFTDSVYEDILNSCPSLRELSVRGMKISDAALIRIAAAPLEYLYIHDMRGYTDTGIAALMDGCASLRELRLFDRRLNSLVKLLWTRKRPGLNLNWCLG